MTIPFLALSDACGPLVRLSVSLLFFFDLPGGLRLVSVFAFGGVGLGFSVCFGFWAAFSFHSAGYIAQTFAYIVLLTLSLSQTWAKRAQTLPVEEKMICCFTHRNRKSDSGVSLKKRKSDGKVVGLAVSSPSLATATLDAYFALKDWQFCGFA